MAVLVALAHAGNHELIRQALLDEVWPDQDVSDDTLTNTMSELRCALGALPPQIHCNRPEKSLSTIGRANVCRTSFSGADRTGRV